MPHTLFFGMPTFCLVCVFMSFMLCSADVILLCSAEICLLCSGETNLICSGKANLICSGEYIFGMLGGPYLLCLVDPICYARPKLI